MTDPRFTDPRLSNPVVRRDENVGGMGVWIAGISALLLIGFVMLAGSYYNSNTASSGSSTSTTASTPARTATPPSTTGSGSSSPQPITPAAPSKSGTQ
jgi:ABC-type phosphate transport system substrate-binding protein